MSTQCSGNFQWKVSCISALWDPCSIYVLYNLCMEKLYLVRVLFNFSRSINTIGHCFAVPRIYYVRFYLIAAAARRRTCKRMHVFFNI